MMRFLPAVIAILATLPLPGCQATTPSGGLGSPAGALPHLTLHQVLRVMPGEASVRLQFGRVVPRNGVQDQEPHCIFEIETVRESVQRVEPDDFEIIGVRRSISDFGSLSAPRHVAWITGVSDDDRPTFIFYRTEFRLRSARQAQVRSLTCQSNQNAPGNPIMRHLTLEEIRATLGSILSLHTREQTAL